MDRQHMSAKLLTIIGLLEVPYVGYWLTSRKLSSYNIHMVHNLIKAEAILYL